MLDALRLKFSKEPYKTQLQGTKDYYLIEDAGSKDYTWGNGCGTCVECGRSKIGERGQCFTPKEHETNNLLGKLLMHVRYELIKETKKDLVSIPGYLEFFK